MKLYVFNPDTDMALANNEENYMAPASACRMAQDLALLPVWYAQPGSAVLAPSAYNADYLQKMKQLFPLSVQLVTEPELPDYAESQIVPWGWNRAFRKRMQKAGIAQHKLPTEAELRECRMLSSRAYGMALAMTFELNKTLKCVCGRHFLISGEGKEFCVPDIVDDFLLSLCICRNGCRYLLTDIQHQLQTAEMHSVPVFGTLVEKPEKEVYKHEAHNDQ